LGDGAHGGPSLQKIEVWRFPDRPQKAAAPGSSLPDATRQPWNDVAIGASIHTNADTHIEIVTYGRSADTMALLFTLLTGAGNRLARPLAWLGNALRRPRTFLKMLWRVGWSSRTVIFLVMQSLDNAIAFRAKRGLLGGVSLRTEQDPERPNPTYIEGGSRAAQWLASRTGGYAQSMILEALANVPTTAHILGGAVVGGDASRGVVDGGGRLYGYRNFLVCDGSTMPANPGVNPSLTITAMSEHFMSQVPARDSP
jgi:cholesterol oxidase